MSDYLDVKYLIIKILVNLLKDLKMLKNIIIN